MARSLGPWLDSEWVPATMGANLEPAARTAVDEFLARVSLYRGDYRSAVKRYQAALVTKPEDPLVLAGLGEALRKAGDVSAAIGVLRNALHFAERAGLSERAQTTRMRLGWSYIELGRSQEAICVLRQLLALGGGGAELWTALSRARLELNRLGGAVEAAKEAIEQDDHLAAPHAVVAAVYLQQGEYRKAIDEAEKALNLDSQDLIAMRIEGRAFLDGEIDVEQGIRLMLHYLDQKPADLEQRLVLARALRLAKHPPREAIDLLTAGIALEPQNQGSDLNLELAETYLDAGDGSEAQRALDRTEKSQSPDPVRYWRIRGDALRLQGKTTEALSAFQQAVNLAPTNLPVLERCCGLLETEKRYPEAVRVWEQANRTKSGDGVLMLKLALAAQKAGDGTRAWSVVSEAFATGLDGDARGVALDLRAEVGEALQRSRDELLVAYYDAGVEAYATGNLDRALHWFDLVLALERSYKDARWYQADTLRRKASLPKYPYWSPEMVANARRMWDEAMKAGYPGRSQAWAYLSGALIADGEGQLSSTSERERLTWQAISYLECSLVLDPGDLYTWVNLSRLYRSADLYGSAQDASDRALKINANDATAIEEQAALLSDRGESREARKWIVKRMELERTNWTEVVQVYLTSLEGKFAEAVDQISKVISAEPEDAWSLSFRADCFRRLALTESSDGGREDNLRKARADYSEILKRKENPAYRAYESGFAWAEYGLGNLEVAARMLESLVDSFLDTSDANYRMIGCCYLRMGQLEKAEKCLNRGIDASNTTPQLDLLDALLLAEIERDAAGWPNRTEVIELLRRLRERIQSARQRVAAVPSVRDELLKLKERGERNTGEWVWVAANAGLARHALETNELGQAEVIYQDLEQDPQHFSETAAALENVAAAYREQGEVALRAGWEEPNQSSKALNCFERAMALQPESHQRELGQLLARKALGQFQLSDPSASTSFNAAVTAFEKITDAEAAGLLAEDCRVFLPNMKRFWDLDTYLREVAQDPATPPALRSLLPRVIEGLGDYLDDELGLNAERDESIKPVFTPIVLEIAPNLVPPEGKENDWPVLQQFLPEMRERIEDEMGVRVPGVSVWSNENEAPDAYVIMVHEVPVTRGRVVSGARYSPSSEERLRDAGINTAELEPASHPLSRQPGSWVPERYWNDAEKAKHCILWRDPLQFAVAHLEAELRRNLSEFLGFQELMNMLESWGTTEARRELIRAALPDGVALERFLRVLHLLLREQVPITNLDRILLAVREMGLGSEETNGLLRRVRLAIKTDLPGNRRGTKVRTVPTEIEKRIGSAVRTVNDRIVVALTPKEAGELLTDLRPLVNEADPNTVFVVGESRTRRPLRRLLEGEYPDSMVQSQEETLSDEDREKQFRLVAVIAEWNEPLAEEKQ